MLVGWTLQCLQFLLLFSFCFPSYLLIWVYTLHFLWYRGYYYNINTYQMSGTNQRNLAFKTFSGTLCFCGSECLYTLLPKKQYKESHSTQPRRLGVVLKHALEARLSIIMICHVSKIYTDFTFYCTINTSSFPDTDYPNCFIRSDIPGRCAHAIYLWISLLCNFLNRNLAAVWQAYFFHLL